MTIMNRKLIIFIVCLSGTILSIILSWIYFKFSYFEPDTVSYLFQAKIFERGKLCYPAPHEYGFSSSPHINILNGKWYSKYPFGNAFMLMFGEFFNAPWIIPAIVTGLALFLLYLIVLKSYNKTVALIAIILGLVSPATLGMGCNWFSESVSRFYLAIYVLGLIMTLKNVNLINSYCRSYSKSSNSRSSKKFPNNIINAIKKRKSWLLPVASGFSLGYAFNTRPMPAIAFGTSGAIMAIYWITRANIKQISNLKALKKMRVFISNDDFQLNRIFINRMLIFLLPFVFMIILCMAWNFYFTGNPLKFTHNIAQPYDKIGFGKRMESYEPDLNNAFVFTPKWAVERIWRHTIPCISFNTLGWGYYRPNILRSFHSYTDSIVAGIIAKSPNDNNWVILKLWGHSDGTGVIQFQTRNDQSSPGLTGSAQGFSCSNGKTEISMRIVKQGDQYFGYFKTDKDWIKVGPTNIPLKPPYEVGIFAGVNPSSGNMDIKYSFFKVNSDSNGMLVSDEFKGQLKDPWKWYLKPKKWEITKSGLNIKADTNRNIFADDQANRLYQVTYSDNFDIETHFIANWQSNERFLTIRIIPLAFPIILMLIPLFHQSRNRYDFFFFSFLIFNLALYFFFYFEGSTWGVTPVNARYYTECTLLGIIPLVARGMFITYGWIRKIPTKIPIIVVVILLLILTINTVYTYIYIAKPYQNWSDVYQKLPRIVKHQGLNNAVIFIPYTRDAPLGDYPFKNLQEADIVYFRLGPNKPWGLNNSDWHKVYEQYFKGKNAFIYESGKLNQLFID
ncbi:MAG: hypothetical protein ACPL7B_03170 [Candidatus Poribacteria bacterium]